MEWGESHERSDDKESESIDSGEDNCEEEDESSEDEVRNVEPIESADPVGVEEIVEAGRGNESVLAEGRARHVPAWMSDYVIGENHSEDEEEQVVIV